MNLVKNRKGVLAIILIVLMVSIQPVFAQGQQARPEEKTYSLNLAVGDPIGSSVGKTAQYFADRVAEETDGRVAIKVHADGVLFGGDQNAAVNMLEDGGLDSLILSTSVYASFEERMNAISLPYLFGSYDEFQSYLEGEPGQKLLASLDKLNTEGLALMIRTFRNVTNSVRPIRKPSDLEGLKLRVPNNKLWVEFFGPLGADPTPMNFTEVYTALQLNTIDGQENPVEVPLANKFYEVQDYLSLTSHIADAYILGFNKDVWDSLDSDLQSTLREVALETAQYKLDMDLAAEAEIIEELKGHGMKVNSLSKDEMAAFQNAALELYPAFESLVGADFMESSLEFLGR